MSDFLQLNVKRRRRNGGFLDDLKEEYKGYQDDPQNIGNKLKEKVEDWLIEEKRLSNPPAEFDALNPLSIGDAILNRVCEIAGHVWLEFVEGTGEDSIRGTGFFQERDTINAHVAEFIPEIEIDTILETFQTEGGSEVLWNNITDEHLLELFGPLLKESHVARKPASSASRYPAGFLNGYMNLIFPDQLRGQGEAWFKDRMDADITPAWQINDPVVITNSIMETEAGLRYSFTPEQYQNADNCVTWASRALDHLVLGDWLDTVRAHCGITQPQCGIASSQLAHKPCEDYHIREEGRMKCIAGYASEADKQRLGGLRTF